MGAIEDYSALIEAVESQRQRLQGPQQPDLWGGEIAKRFRADPKRQMDDNYEILATFVRPDDVFVDAGGGAGRFSLPMALRCRDVINVDPSVGMGEEFDASAAEAGIANARFVLSDWLDVDGVQGDVVHAAHVTYFVSDIERFVAKLEGAARRRVVINLSSIAGPMLNAKLFEMVYSEEQAIVPSHTKLLPVLWEMGIEPDVRFLPHGTHFDGVPQTQEFPQSKEDAVGIALAGVWLAPQHRDRAEVVVREKFDELFIEDSDGFIPQWLPEPRQVLITWETGKTG
jgi:2-polyprenyl-3-methyl-5-hydroxy-6-metoxy-1,4-benzoquinol methylase